MKSWLSAVVCGLFLNMALYFGVVHQHYDQVRVGHRANCAACAWQLNAVTDAPCATPIIFGCVWERPLEVFDFHPYSAPSFSFCPSRAPPVTPA
ncbi:MAG: hypothetical protein ABSG14_05490 [Verrucomicrobiia bacterium]|jgi:hypothetical protein